MEGPIGSGTEERSAARRVFRFAPSPNGFLHRGHAFSALLNYGAAQVCGGRFLLRIEDIDAERCRPEFETAIYADLTWLGIGWEGPVLRQSERLEAYREALGELTALGLLYPAFLSRAEIRRTVHAFETDGPSWPRDPDGAPHYPGSERDWPESRRRDALATGRPYALRLDMRRALAALPALSWLERQEDGEAARVAADPAGWGDVVLARRDLPGSYHLSVVVDDAAQGVTDVVRGWDLKPATAVHRLLQSLLGLPEPTYRHHALILDATGQKLSKSRGSPSLRDLRAAGAAPGDVIRSLPLPITAPLPAAG